MPEFKFFSIDEIKEFVGQLKGQRGGKNKSGDENDEGPTNGASPAPLQPNAGAPAFNPGPAAAPAAFNPGAAPAGFPGAGAAPQGDPAVAALVARIVPRIDATIASGQPAQTVLEWFRGQCGAEAANATLDQIKQHFLPKMTAAALENIAKLIAA